VGPASYPDPADDMSGGPPNKVTDDFPEIRRGLLWAWLAVWLYLDPTSIKTVAILA